MFRIEKRKLQTPTLPTFGGKALSQIVVFNTQSQHTSAMIALPCFRGWTPQTSNFARRFATVPAVFLVFTAVIYLKKK